MDVPELLIVNAPLSEVKTDWLVVGVSECADLSSEVQALDKSLGGVIAQLRQRGDIKAKPGEVTFLPVAPGIQAERVLILGLGDPAKQGFQNWENSLLAAVRKAAGSPNGSIAIAIPAEIANLSPADKTISTAVCAAVVGSSGQGIYKATPERFPFKQIAVVTKEKGEDALARGRILGEAINLTRELVNRHPEEIVPATFATRAEAEAKTVGLKCEIFDQKRLEQERMGSLLAVARGSVHEPRVVILKYEGGGAGAPTLALCGKGVTYDSGGLSLKPSDSMIAMKADMAGAATVLGAMVAIAKLKIPVNVIGLMGLVENMVGPHSYKLGEILTARNGVTIEVHNTDAEGRLVLADVLSYAAEQKPARMIDLATLTGSCVVALGTDIAGAFTNDQGWCDEVLKAARNAGEHVWQLPMHESFAEQLKCDFADIKNVGTKWGGAITAAKFLERFVDDIPWVHLDIAGPSFADAAKPYRDAGATGSSLRTLVAVAEEFSK
ncbi:leucyl aminopeptidase [Planctomicrobium sp. SH661]|uniref:leucyl aminopeptidase n=1 Tax=Planctomicrobium sp. SH661 TaxID=3448124 RepID=UPI003F5C1E2F